MESKKNFIGEDFLLQNKTAKTLYHEYAETMPVIDYHCHLPVQQIADNYFFKNLTDLWLRGDHYKWRAMRTLGVDEKYITGKGSDEEKFLHWAEVVPDTVRNPLFHWTQLELKDPFGITELLNKENAKKIYNQCNKLLAQPEYSAQGLLKHFDVKVVCTTDDPCDDLHFHQTIYKSKFSIKVLPAFRPDKALQIGSGVTFRDYIKKLSKASGVLIKDIDSLLEALQQRVDYFHQHGGRLADHGLNYIPLFNERDKKNINDYFIKVLKGDDKSAESRAIQDNYAGYVLIHLCRMYHAKGWVQQFHLGALRNTNSGKLEKFGANTGFDSIGDFRHATGLAELFDKLDQTGQLSKTILYNLNPADNEIFATMAGNFNEGPVKGKMQFGAAWWFLDQLDGMEKQINALSNMGILSCFVGMLTDSRCFLSYSRHEYFRRLLCNIFGKDMEAGLIPSDEKWIGKIIQDICYNNAEKYFGWK
ncbi:MAG: glucuronate isomerase [Chitinophagaceae bacterium]